MFINTGDTFSVQTPDGVVPVYVQYGVKWISTPCPNRSELYVHNTATTNSTLLF